MSFVPASSWSLVPIGERRKNYASCPTFGYHLVPVCEGTKNSQRKINATQ